MPEDVYKRQNMTSGEQIDAALAFIHKLTARRDAAYNGLLEQLADCLLYTSRCV